MIGGYSGSSPKEGSWLAVRVGVLGSSVTHTPRGVVYEGLRPSGHEGVVTGSSTIFSN